MSQLAARFSGLLGWFGRAKAGDSEVLPVRLGGSRLSATGATPTRAQGFDQPLVWVTVALLLWGLVMVYSASIAMPENPRFANYTHSYFLIRHAIWLLIAVVGSLVAYQVPLAT